MNRFIRHTTVGLVAALLLGAAPASQPSQEELYQQQVQLAQRALEEAEKETSMAMDRTEAIRQELRQATGRADVSPEGMRQAITRLQDRQEQLLLDGAGAEGRRAGLTDAIAKLTSQMKDKANSDAAVDELKQVIALREKELQRLRQLEDSHAVSQKAVEDAQAAVADARVKLIEVHRQAIGNTNAESLEMWNRELMSLSVAELERRARLRFIEGRLNRLSAAVPGIDKLERSLAEEQRAERMLQAAQSRYNIVRQRTTWGLEGPSAP